MQKNTYINTYLNTLFSWVKYGKRRADVKQLGCYPIGRPRYPRHTCLRLQSGLRYWCGFDCFWRSYDGGEKCAKG